MRDSVLRGPRRKRVPRGARPPKLAEALESLLKFFHREPASSTYPFRYLPPEDIEPVVTRARQALETHKDRIMARQMNVTLEYFRENIKGSPPLKIQRR